VLGHGESKVDVRIEPKRATYLISTDARSHGWIGRFLRAIKAPFTMPAMLHELVSQQTEIEDGYTRLFEAHARIEVQAAELEQINRMGQRLAKQIDLHRAADLLVEMMLEDLRFEGVELWLIRPSPGPGAHSEKPRFFRRGGEQVGPPSSTHLLETASRPVGTLKFWMDPTSEAPSNEALLQRLLPWIAMALDNARSYESLERHATDLEHRVKERTARLLAANHHLVKEIEERRRATEALMESEAQLRGAERLASIGTLAAGIAHEINNPIGSILAAAQLAQLIQSERDPAPEISQALEDIIGQAKRCGGIVRSILQFSRDERTEKWDCQLTDIVVRSIRLTTAFAEEHGARMNIEIPATESWAHVNPIQVEQAIVNLLRNAIESGGRTIDVVLDPNPETARVAIEIRDDGSGIPESEQHRILEPFYTTRRPVGGTGLGLSVVHGIATEHGGRLRIESGPSGGTIATLELPTVPPKLALTSRSEAGPLEDKPAEDTGLREES
jgi:signal transduction histidine kinase